MAKLTEKELDRLMKRSGAEVVHLKHEDPPTCLRLLGYILALLSPLLCALAFALVRVLTR